MAYRPPAKLWPREVPFQRAAEPRPRAMPERPVLLLADPQQAADFAGRANGRVAQDDGRALPRRQLGNQRAEGWREVACELDVRRRSLPGLRRACPLSRPAGMVDRQETR